MDRVRLKPKTIQQWVKPKRGAPKQYEANERDRKVVVRMARYAIPREEIRKCLMNPLTGEPISLDTLDRCYSEDMRVARLDVDMKVSKSLHTLALGRPAEVREDANGKIKTVTPFVKPEMKAIQWYEMTRKGLTEKRAVQQLDEFGRPMTPLDGPRVVVILPSNNRELPKLIEAPKQLALPAKR